MSKANSQGRIPHKITVVDGQTFHSKMESDRYLVYKKMKENGEILHFETQVQFLLQEKFCIINGQAIYGSDPNFSKLKKEYRASTIQAITYKADFLVTKLDGTQYIEDTKGRSTPDFEIKRKMCMMKYPQYRFDVTVYNKKTGAWEDYYSYAKEKKKLKAEKAKSEIDNPKPKRKPKSRRFK